MKSHYIYDNDELQGPFQDDQIAAMWKQGRLTANAQYHDDDLKEWLLVSDLVEQMDHPFRAAWKKAMAEQNTPENKQKTKQIQTIAVVCYIGIGLFLVALSSIDSSDGPEYDATKAGMEAGFYVGQEDARLKRAKMSPTTRLERGRAEARSYDTSASKEYYARGWAEGYSKGYDQY